MLLLLLLLQAHGNPCRDCCYKHTAILAETAANTTTRQSLQRLLLIQPHGNPCRDSCYYKHTAILSETVATTTRYSLHRLLLQPHGNPCTDCCYNHTAILAETARPATTPLLETDGLGGRVVRCPTRERQTGVRSPLSPFQSCW